MTLPATDDFTTGSDQNLDTYSANWTENRASGDLVVNEITNDVGGEAPYDSVAHWNADTFNDNQYAEATLADLGSEDEFIGVAVRVHTSANTGYVYEGDGVTSDNKYLAKIITGSFTTLQSSTNTWSATEVIRLEVSGETLTPKINGFLDADLGTDTDSSIESGYAGLTQYGNDSNDGTMDDWEGGNLAAVVTVNTLVLTGLAVTSSVVVTGVGIPGRNWPRGVTRGVLRGSI